MQDPLTGTSSAEWDVKNRDIWLVNRFISELIQDRAIVDYITNSYAINRMVLLIELEWHLTQIKGHAIILRLIAQKQYTMEIYTVFQKKVHP